MQPPLTRLPPHPCFPSRAGEAVWKILRLLGFRFVGARERSCKNDTGEFSQKLGALDHDVGGREGGGVEPAGHEVIRLPRRVGQGSQFAETHSVDLSS